MYISDPFKFRFQKSLKNWYQENYRKLPWRETKDPYFIWLSEIILQQTKVEQGLSYYKKFVRNYPNVNELANASEDQILKDWQGLGYYSRARNLHFAANQIVKDHNGKFPNSYTEILQLKGIGKYTAAAISSFAFDLPHAVVDGNVYRFISRLLGIETPIDISRGAKEFEERANEILDKKNAGIHNQAMMEFGALICKPKSPICSQCPFETSCHARNNNSILELPRKNGKVKQKTRYFNYLIVSDRGNLLLNKRKEKGIWRNLYEFPLIESTEEKDRNSLINEKQFLDLFDGISYQIKHVSELKKHLLTHLIIKAKFYHIEVSHLDQYNKKFIVSPIDQFNEYAVPKLIENYFNEVSKLLPLFIQN